jgi:hypothetical protein
VSATDEIIGEHTLTHAIDPADQSGYWVLRNEAGETRIGGREASVLSLILSGRKLCEDLHPLDVTGRS